MLLLLFGRHVYRRSHQEAAAKASGLASVADLTHVTAALRRTRRRRLAGGGSERGVVHGSLARAVAPEGPSGERTTRTSTSPRSISRRCASAAASGRTCRSIGRFASAAWSA